MDIKDILKGIGYANIKQYGDYLRMSPIYRHSDSACLSVHKKSGHFVDFARSDEMRGDFNELIRLSLKLKSKNQAKEWLKDKNIKFEEYDFQYDSSDPLIFNKKFSKDNLKYLTDDHSYWLNRNVSLDTVRLFKGGLDNGVEGGKFYNRYVFPIFHEKGFISGFTGRDVSNNPRTVKWKHIGQTSSWVYPSFLNSDSIIESKEVIILESIGDMLALYDCGIRNTVVVFGVSLSSSIITYLLRHRLDNIVIALNNDSENNNVGNKAAVKFKNQLSKHINHNKININLPSSKKDFGEMSKNEIFNWRNNVSKNTIGV